MIVQKNRVGNPICLIAFVLALSAAPLAGQVPLDRQGNPSLEGVTGNDTPATATLFAPGGTFPPTAYRAAFDSATDVDFYKVRLQFGETLAIRVTAFSSPGPLFGATFFDVTGTRVLPAFHGLNASSKKVSAISFTAPAAGDYLFECTSGLTMTRYDLTIGIYQNTNANLPDFSNGTLSAQASALPSDVVQVTTSLDGIFDGTAGGSANFSALGAVMLSAHAIPDETAREVGRLGFLDFTTGPSPATKSAVTTVAIPPVPPGNYFLVLKADPDDLVHESSESNNFGAPSAFAVLPRNGTASDPDLTSSAVTGPATASIDKGILASGVVTNGGGSAAGTFQVGFVLSSSGTVSVADPLIGTTSVASLARGASTAVTVRGLVPATLSSGTYRVGMIADVGATVQEANESNNTAIGAASTLVSTPADLADLVVSSYVAQPAGLLGFAATFTASVRNIGGTPAPASKTGFWVGRTLTRQAQDVMVALADTPPLAPGASATVAVTSGYPANLPPNVYAASAEVNQAGNVLESNRSNNILFSAGLTTLVNPADISVTSVSGPSSGSVEDNVLVVAGVKNRSAATSPGFSVQFFLSKDRVFSRADDVFLGDPVGVTPVSGGATRAITTAPVVPSVLTSGSYILGLAVDLPGALTDPDRSNNVAFAATSMTIGRPLDTQADLVALSAAFTRTAAKTGELFGVSASIRNRGHVRSPAFASAFVLSRDRIFLPPSAPVGGDALVASIPVGGLAAGQTTVLTAPARVPLTLAAGTYVLGFIADVLGTVPEFSKTNNTVGSAGTMAITTSGDFDLINRGITCSPTVFSSGQTIRVTSTLEMIGGTQPVDVTLGLDLFTPPAGNDNPFGETVVPGLRPNEVRQVTQQVVVPFVPVPDPNLNGGNYSLVSIIDPRAALSQPRFGDLPPRPASVTVTPPNPTSLPNLIPGAVGGPASTQPGAPVQVTATVTNSSSISVVATFAVVFFIEERDPASSPPMRLRLGDIAVRGLGAGVALPLTATFAVPLLAHPGAYAVVAQADPFRNVFENNEGDNVAAAASVTQLLQATSLTNLAAVSVEADRSVSIGNTLHVTGTVRNDGPGSVQGAALAFVLTHGEEPGLSSPLLGPPVALPAMAANETKAVRAAYSVAPWVAPGSYSVAMLVDPGDFIPETNETDNVSASALGVTISAPLSPALLPDLTVEQVSPAPTGPSRRFAGGTAALVGSVRNRGGGDAALPFSTRFFLVKDPASGPDAGLTLGSAAVSSLASGQAAIVSGSFPLPLLPPGDYFLGLAVDSEGRVPDGNSRNNVLVSADRFTISTPPLLAAAPNVSVASISAASGAAVATTFSARVGIAATGAPAALPVDVLLLLTRGSQVPSAGDIAVGRGTVVVPAGGMATAALTAFVRPGTPAGTYSLAAIADPQQLLPDPDRRDNVLVVSVSSFAVASGPALLDDYLPPAGQPVPSSLPEPQRITPGGPPILGLIEAAGDRDAFFFDLAAPGGNLQAELAARGSEDLSLEAIGPGGTRSSGISGGGGQPCRLFNFPATSPGRYVLVASHRTASGTGGYALSARLTAGVTAVVDLLPGAISVAPIAPTTRDGIAMRWSIANAGPTTSGTFAWDLRLVPQDCTLCAGGQGEAAALDLASGRLARLPGRSSVDLGPISTGPLPAGKYRVVLSIDTQAEVSEAIESNNTREIPLEVLPARRTEGLAVAALAVEPFQPTTATSRVVALGAVSNRGSERTTRFDIQFVLDRTSVARGSIVTRFFIEGLPPASRLALRPVPLPVLVQGAHTLTLELDPDGRLAQSNPDEGRLTIGFGVGPNRVSGFDLATGLVSVEPAAPTTRDALVLSGVVFNRGDAASSEVSLRAVLDGVTVATGVRVASIPAGGTATLPALPLSSGARAGAHRLTVSVAPVAGSEANPFDNETSLVFGVAEAVRSTRTLACSGVVSDAFGQAPPAGTRVRVLNRSRGLATARSLVPANPSVEGSWATTLGGPGALIPVAAAEGDRLEFVVERPDGGLLTVSDPATRLVTGGDISRGAMELSLRVVPPPAGLVTVRVLRPSGGDVFYADESIAFEASASGPDGRRLTGRGLTWRSSRLALPFGVGETFFARLPVGPQRVEIEARDDRGVSTRVAVDVVVQDHTEQFARRFTVAGEARLARDGQPIAAGSIVSLVNAHAAKSASALVRAGGLFAVTLADLQQPVATLGEVLRLEVRDPQGRRQGAAPALFTIQLRDLVTLGRTINLRVGTPLAPKKLHVLQGINLLSLPVNPDTTGQAAFTSENLLRLTGAGFVARVRMNAGGDGRFEVFLPGITPAFDVIGNEGYVLHRAAPESDVDVSGLPWPEEQANRMLPRGTGIVALPLGAESNLTADELLERTGSAFVVRGTRGSDGHGRFEAFLKGFGTAFQLQEGTGYIVGAPSPEPLTLPGQP